MHPDKRTRDTAECRTMVMLLGATYYGVASHTFVFHGSDLTVHERLCAETLEPVTSDEAYDRTIQYGRALREMGVKDYDEYKSRRAKVLGEAGPDDDRTI